MSGERIERAVMMETDLAKGAQTIAWFEEIGSADRPHVGGKGASLGELERAGIPVPPGFVVTTGAYRAFIARLDTGLRADIAALATAVEDRSAEQTAQVRGRIEAEPLPAELATSLSAAYARLCAGSDADFPVAVRSSATSEDGAAASFAGLQDTYLWVRGAAAVADAVRRCWASLFSDAAVSYRRRLQLNDDAMAMGVVIQRMVNARSAGVAFTRSPLSGDPSVVAISASWGLGSTVVGGEVTPDEFIVNKITGLVTRSTVSCKELRHVPNPSGSGVHDEPVPAELQNEPALTSTEISTLTTARCAFCRVGPRRSGAHATPSAPRRLPPHRKRRRTRTCSRSSERARNEFEQRRRAADPRAARCVGFRRTALGDQRL
jgi:pyruvate,water dikinase